MYNDVILIEFCLIFKIVAPVFILCYDLLSLLYIIGVIV